MHKILKISSKIIIYILFATYLAYLFDLVFFKYRSAFTGINDITTLKLYLKHSANFQPFKTIMNYINNIGNINNHIIITNILGNIVAFMPFGVFLPLALRFKGILKIMIHSFFLSFFIETVQLTFRVGSFDIDDIILNTFGGLLGYIFYLLATKFIHSYNKKKKLGDA